MPNQSVTWQGGRTYVFQGTVQEDATAGTHISSLTVVPGAGNEFKVLYARFLAGGGAANLTGFLVDDGTNILINMLGSGAASGAGQISLASGQEINWPNGGSAGQAAANQQTTIPPSGISLSGAMRFIMRTSTATVSLTHTFAVVLRVFGDSPTFTLADSVGSPTLTTNTSGFF